MAEAERRVVLLARAGVACERLRGALVEAGANLVLEGDPTVLDPAALDAADPEVVVVVLDPAAEDALDRFENLLVDPSIEVIFEEAELAASREGWDAARWARHLSAKLNRHDDVLPPGREPEPEAPPVLVAEGFQRPLSEASPLAQEPVSPDIELAVLPQSEPAAVDYGDIEEIEAVEAFEIEPPQADSLRTASAAGSLAFDAVSAEPASDASSFAAAEQIGELGRVAPIGSAGDRVLSEPPPLPDEAREFFARQALGTAPLGDEDVIEIQAYAADDDVEELTAQPVVQQDVAYRDESDFDFTSLTLEAVDNSSTVPGQPQPYSQDIGDWVQAEVGHTDLPVLDETGLGDLDVWRAPAPNRVQELVDLDAAFAAEGGRIDFDATRRDPTPIAPIEFDDGHRGQDGADSFKFESTVDFDSHDVSEPLAARTPPPSVPSVPDWSFSDEASLVSAATGQSGAHGGASLGKHDLDEIERRISGLELVDDRLPATTRNGAILVLAGIGGPDAVRQLLGALPEDFQRPVLVQQRLDGGRYDKLVAQMQRATSVLVKLAEPGSRTIAGVIYILPAGVGIEVSEGGIQFVEGGDVLEALPAADSAVLLFSGADPAQVDAAMKLSGHGALVAGQAPDGCYDAAAATAAIARGAGQGQPAELAAKLATRWSRPNPN
ncbi:chemotaxis protein CheB [Lysobacter sp. CA199]|uniref:chemotaxis protein CheB n=1 Tax=Lysobacter sp. CA199 TaxID=3455608 RepID=UPI003F8D49CA